VITGGQTFFSAYQGSACIGLILDSGRTRTGVWTGPRTCQLSWISRSQISI